MEIQLDNKTITFNKKLTNLDIFVKDFVEIIEELEIDYVIISGYISIVFGRSRNTEDIDTIIDRISKAKFDQLWIKLIADFECMNTSNKDEAYDYLNSNTALRFFKKDKFIPNMEIKFKKSRIDEFSLKNKIRVIIDNLKFNTSLIELQIAYKLFMGSDKDIEDAKFLYNIFKSYLNIKILEELLNDFGKEAKQRFEMIK